MRVRNKREKLQEEEEKKAKEIRISLKTLIAIILIIVVLILGLMSLIIKILQDNMLSSNISIKRKENNSYYVIENDYSGEYDLQNRIFSFEEFDNTEGTNQLFNKEDIMTYEEYIAYCQKWELNPKYTDASLKYIVFSALESETEGIDVRIADVKYKSSEVDLYIWDDLGGYKENVSVYFIVIPTDKKIDSINIVPLYTDEEVENMVTPYRLPYDDPEMLTVDKPIIYLYPEKETEISVKLGNSDKLTCSYPKYQEKGWNVKANSNGDLIDLDTGRKLYSLYYESKAEVKPKVKSDGFIVKGTDTIKFLEEKLDILGLTEKEAEEFIIYWLPKLENNKYNYIRFQTIEEIDKNMPLEISPKPDTLIRIIMTYKPLEEEIEVKEQKLETLARKGFVAVEWGGSEIK